jgi:hypothetical protein
VFYLQESVDDSIQGQHARLPVWCNSCYCLILVGYCICMLQSVDQIEVGTSSFPYTYVYRCGVNEVNKGRNTPKEPQMKYK